MVFLNSWTPIKQRFVLRAYLIITTPITGINSSKIFHCYFSILRRNNFRIWILNLQNLACEIHWTRHHSIASTSNFFLRNRRLLKLHFQTACKMGTIFSWRRYLFFQKSIFFCYEIYLWMHSCHILSVHWLVMEKRNRFWDFIFFLFKNFLNIFLTFWRLFLMQYCW